MRTFWKTNFDFAFVFCTCIRQYKTWSWYFIPQVPETNVPTLTNMHILMAVIVASTTARRFILRKAQVAMGAGFLGKVLAVWITRLRNAQEKGAAGMQVNQKIHCCFKFIYHNENYKKISMSNLWSWVT